jgi:hypothetical protein
VLSLYGIWNDSFLLPKDFFSWWWLVTVVILVFAGFGAWREIQKRSTLAWTIVIVFVPTLLLAVGYGSSFTRPIIDFLYVAFPFFRGMRDTAKITGVLAFAYAFLFPIGISFGISFFKKVGDWIRPAAIVAVFPLLWAGTLLWGGFGHIKPHTYPAGWYGAEAVLKNDQTTENVLFLPWHIYLKLNFAGDAMVANPAPVFFSERMIVGKDTDNQFLSLAEKTSWDDHVLVLTRKEIPDEREFWKSENVSHIVIAKTDDWEKFSNLYASDFYEKVFDDDSMVVFKLKE